MSCTKSLVPLVAMMVSGACAESPPPGTRLQGTLGERQITLSVARHHTLLELDHGSHAQQSRPGQLNKVQRCSARLVLVLSSSGDGCSPRAGGPARSHTLKIPLDLTAADPTRATVTDARLVSGGRVFRGEGTLLLSTRSQARVPRKVRCNKTLDVGSIAGALSGHLVLSFYVGRHGSDRLGWLEGDFLSRDCHDKNEIIASIE